MNIGRYQVVRLLGQGGMASVYEATESALNRRVAIKVLHANMSNDPEVIARFVSEGRIVNGIRHPSLVPVHEQGQLPDRSYYIVMDLLEGETLSRRMARSVHRPMSMEEALRIVRQVAEALATVHRHGVVHRDIKPDNLMLIPDPAVLGGVRVKILDFGLAKAPRVRAVGEHINTVIGCAYGTLCYMAPEQMFDARAATDRADVYSLGSTLFELLAGRTPFLGSEPLQIWGAQLTKEPPDIRELVPNAPRMLSLLIQRMLHRDPANRPAMEDVLRQLNWLYRDVFLRSSISARDISAGLLVAPSPKASSDARTVLQPEIPIRQPSHRVVRRMLIATLVAMPLLLLVYSCSPGASIEKQRKPSIVPSGGTTGTRPPSVSPLKRAAVQGSTLPMSSSVRTVQRVSLPSSCWLMSENLAQ